MWSEVLLCVLSAVWLITGAVDVTGQCRTMQHMLVPTTASLKQQQQEQRIALPDRLILL